MSKAIRNYVRMHHDKIVYDAIKLVKNSPFSDRVWVIVEGVTDVIVYKEFFDDSKVFINTSNIGSKRNCEAVETIVSHYSDDGEIDVIGIRDTDYTRFLPISTTNSQKLFYTDCSDIETMMISAKAVINVLSDKYPDLQVKLDEAIKIARHIGVYRIYNSIAKYKNASYGGFNFDSIKVSDVVDIKNKCAKHGYELYIKNLFEAHLGLIFDYSHWKQKYEVISNNDSDYCQGHSIISYLLSLKISRHNLSKDDFIDEVISAYHSTKSFYDSTLYRSLKDCELNKKKNILLVPVN